MTTGYARTSVADIVTGLIVEAAPLNAELNAILAAFHATTGHNHDGTTGGGAKIHLGNSIDTATKLGLHYGGTNADLSAATANAAIFMNSGATGLTYVKNNFSGAVAPAVTDDSASGYTSGSLWLNIVAGAAYMCSSAAVGAAVWVNLASASSIAAVLGKVLVTTTDTTPAVLDSTITVTSPLRRTINNPGADETYGISVDAATETSYGAVQFADFTTVAALTTLSFAVSPGRLGALTASETRIGLVRLATTAETTTGTAMSTAATPAGVASAITANVDLGQIALYTKIFGMI